MINLLHKFALLANGTIEPLYYSDGDMRMAYKEDGKYYLDHDVWGDFMGHRCCAFLHDEIVRTANTKEELTAG